MEANREFESDVAAIMRDLAPLVLSWPKDEAQRASYRFLAINCQQGYANIVQTHDSLDWPIRGPFLDMFHEALDNLVAIAERASSLIGLQSARVPASVTRYGTKDAFLATLWSVRVMLAASIRTAYRMGPIDAEIVTQAEWTDQALDFIENMVRSDRQVA